ncbi:hypothetical protein [Marinicella meishanensis]|uniref:hypothetical protein n=1 Tax=Marinicella meishanensis TaxID=2873263 RepID=UPI001CBE5CF9|nr:hypothetical protein [Marinicella sp. NBU2979]
MNILKCIPLMLLSLPLWSMETCDAVNEQDAAAYVEDEALVEEWNHARELTAADCWFIELSQHLMQHEDSNIKMLGAGQMHFHNDDTMYSNLAEPLISKQELSAVITDLLHDPNASLDSLLLAQYVCDDAELSCSLTTINEATQIRQPNNMVVYLSDLEMAVAQQDLEWAGAILQRMGQTDQHRMFHPLPLQLTDAIETYLRSQPLSDQARDVLVQNFSPEPDASIDDLARNHFLLQADMMKFLFLQAYAPLFEACEYSPKRADVCLTIGQIMIENSDSSLAKLLGHGLQSKVHQMLGDEKAEATSKANSKALSDRLQCLVANHHLLNESIFYSDASTHIMLNANSEFERLEKMAVLYHDTLREQGVTDLVDPVSCELAYVERKP